MLKRPHTLFLCAILQMTISSLYGQMQVDSILVSGKVLRYQAGNPMRFTASDHDLTFFFSSKNIKTDHYRYQLRGFDDNWTTSSYPATRYNNLKGGNYELQVEGITAGNVSGRTQISFSVERELMEEWWFIPSVIVYVLVLLSALMYFFILYHFKQKLKVQAIRNRLAADLHDEVGATLSSIAMATNMVQRKVGDSTEVQNLLAHIRSDSEETINTIRDTVWTINPDNDSPAKLFEKMRSLAFQMLAVKEIAVQFENEARTGNRLGINMEQRRNLYLIFKEAINNIAKHSSAGSVNIRVSQSRDGLCLRIEDDGVGFDISKPSEGNGLKNFRTRAAESFIDLTIESSPGMGTRISMIVPDL
ncbi:ATP-binding protein [Dyadobacter arcticus]|uniref:histidine kinase n=1 Tax=Dyadobacter arcticus TaxID=1078754 RepID=A0ABX0UK83_9BACT|nr:histidine kinase [Dyadobacter arcticus]NIJ52873.1 nitrate/nitrite-specific signal transduction histidine kinase [Dyadobacter arcticus]